MLPLLGGLAAYAAVTEILQAVLPIDRHGDLRDLVADVTGVLVGLALELGVDSVPVARSRLRLRTARPAARCPCRRRG